MRRVVITGFGLITPLGLNVEDTWAALVAGKSGAGPITQFNCEEFNTRFACEVKDWDPAPYFEKRESKTVERFLQFAVGAGLQAMDDAGFENRRAIDGEEERWGVYFGSGLGGVHGIEQTHSKALAKGPRRGFSPYFVPNIIINMAAGLLSIKTGAKGPNLSHVSACATGAHCIGEAARAIRWDDADVMIAGGSEATVSLLGLGGFAALRALSTRNDDPQGASRPFDRDRDGFVFAEGAAAVVLEELEHAKRRGARMYGELAGYGSNSDAFHITQPSPEGEGAQRCIHKVLRDAKLEPTDIDYINAHGTSTHYNDKNETIAIQKVFGDHANVLPISSTKSMTGHMFGATGAAEAIFATLSMIRNVIPPTINLQTPDPECPLDYVPNVARDAKLNAVLSNSFGFGGTNATLIIKRYTGD